MLFDHFKRLQVPLRSQKETIQNIVMAFIEYSSLSSEILYRRLVFGIRNILDEPDERISVQEIEVSVPTRKCTISDEAR